MGLSGLFQVRTATVASERLASRSSTEDSGRAALNGKWEALRLSFIYQGDFDIFPQPIIQTRCTLAGSAGLDSFRYFCRYFFDILRT